MRPRQRGPSKYYTPDYPDKTQTLAAANAFNERIVEEGIVLLKNENNALPIATPVSNESLSNRPRISVFGKSSLLRFRFRRTRFIVLAAIIITDNIFNAITMYNSGIDKVSLWIERGYNIFTCLLSLQLQFSQLTEKDIQTKYDAVQHILREEQKQYMLVKQNLDTINIKCHDMKHQLKRLRPGGEGLGNEEIDEIEKVMSIYDSVVKTGNDTLDLILAETT